MRAVLLIVGLLICLTASAQSLTELRLKSGRVLKSVVVLGYANSSFMARWEGGRGTIAYVDLPDDIRKKFEEHKPIKAAESVPEPEKSAPEPVKPKPEPEKSKAPPAEIVEGKVTLGEIDLKAIEELSDYIRYAWKAEVINGTKRPYQADAQIKLIDGDGFELDSALGETQYIAPGKRATVTGTGMVKRSLWEATKSFRVKLD